MSIYPGIDDKRVVRVPGQRSPSYKLASGSKISFSDAPAGTLKVTKRENGVISTVESDFAGGTLELTDPDILDAYIEDSGGNKLFQLGKKVGDNVFDYQNPTRIGSALGRVEVAGPREIRWGLEFDGTNGSEGFVVIPSSPSFDIDYQFTVLFQIIPDNLKNYQGLFGLLDDYNWYGVAVDCYADGVCEIMTDGDYHYLKSASQIISDYQYNCIGVTYGNGTMKAWLNGIEVASKIGDITPIGFGSAGDLHLGWRAGSDIRFKGLWVLPTFFFSYALPPEKISLLTQGRFSEVSREGCVLWLDYDPDYASQGKVRDFSGYGNHGTIVGGVRYKRVVL